MSVLGGRGDKFAKGRRRKLAFQCFQSGLGFLRAQPSERAHSLPRLPIGERQLPSRRMAQFHDLLAEVQRPSPA